MVEDPPPSYEESQRFDEERKQEEEGATIDPQRQATSTGTETNLIETSSMGTETEPPDTVNQGTNPESQGKQEPPAEENKGKEYDIDPPRWNANLYFESGQRNPNTGNMTPISITLTKSNTKNRQKTEDWFTNLFSTPVQSGGKKKKKKNRKKSRKKKRKKKKKKRSLKNK